MGGLVRGRVLYTTVRTLQTCLHQVRSRLLPAVAQSKVNCRHPPPRRLEVYLGAFLHEVLAQLAVCRSVCMCVCVRVGMLDVCV